MIRGQPLFQRWWNCAKSTLLVSCAQWFWVWVRSSRRQGRCSRCLKSISSPSRKKRTHRSDTLVQYSAINYFIAGCKRSELSLGSWVFAPGALLALFLSPPPRSYYFRICLVNGCKCFCTKSPETFDSRCLVHFHGRSHELIVLAEVFEEEWSSTRWSSLLSLNQNNKKINIQTNGARPAAR